MPLIKENKNSNKAGLPTALENFLYSKKQEIIKTCGWEEDEYSKLTKIIQKCKVFGTPDLAAKYYMEIGDFNSYSLLKMLISTFFYETEKSPDLTGQGFENMNLDARVVPFLTTISDKKKLPDNLKIISWNYDTQIEKGAGMLHPISGGSDFNMNFNVWPFKANNTDRVDKDYFLLHLNGICGYIYSEHHLGIENPYLFDFNRQLEPLLSFAWEDDDSFKKKTFTDKRLSLAKTMIDKTTILVVIGYSFPFFNRKVDAELFSIMKPTLKKIYFQDPNLNGDFLHNQFGLLKENRELIHDNISGRIVDIVPIKDVSQYYVPFEL